MTATVPVAGVIVIVPVAAVTVIAFVPVFVVCACRAADRQETTAAPDHPSLASSPGLESADLCPAGGLCANLTDLRRHV